MRTWPPYSPDDPPEDPIPDAEFEHQLVVHGLAVGPYAPIAAVQAELAQLGELRDTYRQARWVITASRIVAAVLIVAWMWTGSAGYGAAALGFTLLAVHQSRRPDVYRERGRELDADIADARERHQRLQRGDEAA